MKLQIPVVVAVATTAVVGAASAPAAPSASEASVVTCKTRVYAKGPVYVTSARNLACVQAKREQARYAWTGKNTFSTPGGYRCRPSGRGAVGYQIRCVKGAKVYRIEFAD